MRSVPWNGGDFETYSGKRATASEISGVYHPWIAAAPVAGATTGTGGVGTEGVVGADCGANATQASATVTSTERIGLMTLA
ncbi:MAG: hypothetical protein ACKPEA_01585, partial [Planctomycetota bacterium]